jgi:RimJ/RimL family protein N-acetyltransferase
VVSAIYVVVVTGMWLFGGPPGLYVWVFTGLTGVMVVSAITSWWKSRAVSSEPQDGVGVELIAVDEAVLARLVEAAVDDASPDEVTPPMAGMQWGPERIEWLRRLHRDRRVGLAGPLGEATWAVARDGAIVGGVRLKRTEEPDVLETGIWLVRSARSKGVGREAIAAVLEKAREHGARAVRADTSPQNAAALYVLQRLGFRTWREGERVQAVRELA